MILYNSLITTKNDTIIPVLNSGKTLESRYNPQQDAERKILNQPINSNIVLLLGIGSGIYASQIAKNNPDKLILALESSKEDIDFLSQIESFSNLFNIPNIKIFTFDEIENVLINNYLPSFYGNLQIIEQKAWIEENVEFSNQIKNKITNTLKSIAADFSVQANFGKIWQRNIYKNIYNLSKYNNHFIFTPDTNKTAAIIAAGPSLDDTISYLKESDSYFIISTDTAYQSLVKNKIIPDIVVSVDGQNVSYNHFLNIPENSKTIFLFDVSGNSTAVEKLINQNEKIYFINSNHPFVNYINLQNNVFPNLFSGTGTVTIAALDLAIQCGFTKIKIFGADFSYINGKSYTKGTYLEQLYEKNSNHLISFEKLFSKLQYRTELIKKDDKIFTTEILESYRTSMEDFLNQYNSQIDKKNNIYEIFITQKIKKMSFKSQSIDYYFFMEYFKKEFNKINFEKDTGMKLLKYNCILSLLPYISFLRMQKENIDLNLVELSKLAYKNIVRYN